MGLSKEFLRGLMDNPNFKKWFGESVVRDVEGLPLEVYHGTANSFDTFAPTGMGAGSRESGLGSWFTENLDVADNFANFARSSDRAKSGPAIIPGSLKMANPWKPESYDDIRDLVDKFTEFERPGYMFRDRNIRMSDDKVDHAAAVNHLKSQGYDGIMLEKTRVDSPDDGETLVNQYIAFDPTQFKSRFNAGTFDPSDPNFLKSLGLMTAGAGAAAYAMSPDDAQAMYIGPKGLANLFGQDAAKSMLTDAEKMAARGVDNEAIRQATGLFQGMDGKWRFEVDDSGARLTPWTKDVHGQSNISWDKRPGPAVAMNTEDFISHPSLERAYWPTREQGPGVFYQHIPGDPGSRYSPSQDTIYMSAQSRDADKEGMGSALHELQHAIQQREGFARGGSPSQFEVSQSNINQTKDASILRYLLGDNPNNDINEAKKRFVETMGREPATAADVTALKNDFETLNSRLAEYENPHAMYSRLAGEIEARDTAARMNFTPEQRMATPPDLRDNAIVRFGGGTAASTPNGRAWAKDAGSNTPNVAQAVTPSDPFAQSPSKLAATAALAAALKAKDAPLEDTYQPADLLTAFLTGGGGLMSRGIQAAIDPAVSAAFDYVPRFADAINPRNIVMGLMR